MDRKKNGNMYKLLLANAITEIGNNMYKFALAMYVLNKTSSSLLYSVIVICGILPNAILGIFSGVFVDKHNKKAVMAYSNLLSGIFIVIFIFLFRVSLFSLWIFAVYSIIIGIFQTYSNSAMNASTPELVSTENVSKTNSIMQASDSLIAICGPIMGAVAYKRLGMIAVMVIDGISFVLGYVLIQCISYSYQRNVNASEKKSSMKKDLAEILYFLKEEKSISFFLIMALTINLIYYPIKNTVVTFLSYNILHISEVQVSFIQAASGVGTILGALWIIFHKDNMRFLKRFFIYLALQGGLIAFLIFPGIFARTSKVQITIIYFVIFTAIGILNTIQNLPLITYFQINTPENLRGRLFSVLTTCLLLFAPIGLLIYGVLLNIVNWMVILLISSAIMIALCIYGSNTGIFMKFRLFLNEEKSV